MITKVRLSQVFPNPFQPESRMKVSEETARQFGESILKNGLILTPVGRIDPDYLEKPDHFKQYQLGDGYLRLQGFIWLVAEGQSEYSEIPIDVRDLTDQQMADMVIEANEVRQNLNPIDKAIFYKKCLRDLPITQDKLAERYKIEQGTLSNTIRLLDLPASIQLEIISQKISMTHALILVPLKDWPGLLEGLVKKVIAENLPTAALREEVNQILNRQKKSKKLEPPPCAPPSPEPVVTTTPPVTSMKPETRTAVIEVAGKAAEILKNDPPMEVVATAPKPAELEKQSETRTEPLKPAKIIVVSKWKRKLSVEELASVVRVSLMSEKGFVVKNLEGNLNTALEQLPDILEEANNKWEGK